MPEPREYYVILREPGSEECWDGGSARSPEWRTSEPWTDTRERAHHWLSIMLWHTPSSRAIVARVRETTVEEPGETKWVIRDAEGRYYAGYGRWTPREHNATRYYSRSDAGRTLLVLNPARSIEPITLPGETRVVREILPEVDDG